MVINYQKFKAILNFAIFLQLGRGDWQDCAFTRLACPIGPWEGANRSPYLHQSVDGCGPTLLYPNFSVRFFGFRSRFGRALRTKFKSSALGSPSLMRAKCSNRAHIFSRSHKYAWNSTVKWSTEFKWPRSPIARKLPGWGLKSIDAVPAPPLTYSG